MKKIQNGFGFIVVISLLLFTETVFGSQTHLFSEINNPIQDWDMASYDIQNSGNVVLVGTNSYLTFPETAPGDGFSIVFDGTGGGDANYLYIRGGAGNPDAQSNLFRITRDTGSINMYGNLSVTTSVTVGNGLTVSSGGVNLPDDTVDSGEVNFNYALAGSKGGGASGLTCNDCVALGTETVGVYAASSSEAGPATGLECTDCVTLTGATTGNYATSGSENGSATGLECSSCVTMGTETVGNYAGSSTEGGSATNAYACSGDSVCSVGNTVRSTDGSLGVSGSGYGMDLKIDTDGGSADYYLFYSDGVEIVRIGGDTGNVQLDGDWTTPGKVYSNKFCDIGGNICLEGASGDQLYVETDAGAAKGLAAGSIYASDAMMIGSTASPEDDLHIRANNAQIKLGDTTAGPHGIVFEDNTAGSGVQLFYRTTSKRLIIESSSGGTLVDGTNQFVYDRDDGFFAFYQDVGINMVPSYDLDVTGNMYTASYLTVMGRMGIRTTSPVEELDVRGSVRIDGNLHVAGGDVFSTGPVEIENNRFTQVCIGGDTSKGVTFDTTLYCSSNKRRVIIGQCSPSGWYTQKYWEYTDYSC